VTGTIKKNIQTTTIYIFCVVWVLTVPKYIDIRLNRCEKKRRDTKRSIACTFWLIFSDVLV
jgi:hypothetical protein